MLCNLLAVKHIFIKKSLSPAKIRIPDIPSHNPVGRSTKIRSCFQSCSLFARWKQQTWDIFKHKLLNAGRVCTVRHSADGVTQYMAKITADDGAVCHILLQTCLCVATTQEALTYKNDRITTNVHSLRIVTSVL